jgi:hypothetical protein
MPVHVLLFLNHCHLLPNPWPKWYSQSIVQSEGVQPEHLVLKLTEIINDAKETTENKLKAMDMMMKYRGIYQTAPHHLEFNQINIQSVLD